MALDDVALLDVWLALGGSEPKHGRAPAFWRGSKDSNISLNPAKNAWYDFAANVGGGVLALVETALSCGRGDGLRWLEREGFIEGRHFSDAERQEYREHQDAARTMAALIRWWAYARVEELEYDKSLLFSEGASFGDRRCAIRAARELHELQNGGAHGIARAFAAHRAADPAACDRLIEVGRARWQESREITAVVVGLYRYAAEREASSGNPA